MVILASLALAAAVFLPQEDEPSLQEELAALIERTNQIETFHLVFDMESESEGEARTMVVELVYRAPDFGRFRYSGSAGEVDQWIVGDCVYLLQEQQWKRAKTPPMPLARQLLDERFPPEERPLGPGVAFWVTFQLAAPGQSRFNLNCGSFRTDRDLLLGWLGNLQRWPGVVVEGDELRWGGDGMRCVVARESGLLKEVTGSSAKGRMRLALREGRVDEQLELELVTLPEEARTVPESEELARTFVQSLPVLRSDVFALVESRLARGQREWNALVRRDWEAVLDALHREPMTRGTAKLLTELRRSIPERAERARKDRGEEGSQERKVWEERVAESRASLEASLEKTETRYRESIGTENLPSEPRQELLDVEDEVLDALWAELVRDPMLALFYESFAEAAK